MPKCAKCSNCMNFIRIHTSLFRCTDCWALTDGRPELTEADFDIIRGEAAVLLDLAKMRNEYHERYRKYRRCFRGVELERPSLWSVVRRAYRVGRAKGGGA